MTGKMDVKSHWEKIYKKKSPTEVSWYQTRPSLSLQFIKSTGIEKRQGIIDVGGGASSLVDCLLDEGYKVKVTIRFRGRELAHTELGRNVLEKVLELLEDTYVVDKSPAMIEIIGGEMREQCLKLYAY